jgi:two-component system, NarL family, sensor kinase
MPGHTPDMFFNLILSVLIVAILSIFSVLIYIKHKQRRRDFILEKQKMVYEYENAKLVAQLEMQEMTFKIISQEIHDNIGQILSLAKLNLNTLNWNAMEEVQEKTNAARDLVVRSISDLRDLSRSLHPDWILDRGFLQALEFELRQYEKLGLKSSMHSSVTTLELANTQQLTLFRVLQEIFQNITKHANATAMKLKIDQIDNELSITVIDDGKGISDEELTRGLGLRNMQHRIGQLGGQLKIQNVVPTGTMVEIKVPIISKHGQNSIG